MEWGGSRLGRHGGTEVDAEVDYSETVHMEHVQGDN